MRSSKSPRKEAPQSPSLTETPIGSLKEKLDDLKIRLAAIERAIIALETLLSAG
jgi:hypothetical protein